MNDKKQNKPSGKEIAADILQGAATALSYTDEEILATMPPHEAQEFIDLRNRVIGDISTASEYGSDDQEIPLAAEEDSPYK